ncbi:MAG: hypothetical protein A2138_19390, partial [Deltaproteobacteria bacterium RBG_16_71_12]
MPAAPVSVSIVIPVRDEAESIAGVVQEVDAALAGRTFEVIVVDDGSRDGTWSVLERLAADRPSSSFGAVRLRQRAGKSAALAAGVARCRADIIVTLDGDGQDDPAEIAPMMALLDAGEGADVVVGWKQHRIDSWSRRAQSRIFNVAVSLATGVNLRDHNSGLKVARAEVFREVPLYGELHRFFTVLAHSRGFRLRETPVKHRARSAGRSKYGAGRAFYGLLDLLLVRALLAFDGRAHYLLGALGLALLTAGTIALAYLGSTWLDFRLNGGDYKPLTERPLTIYAATALMLGAQLM